MTPKTNPAKTASAIALCAMQPLSAQGEVPEWVHLLPAGEIRTNDNRGPYTVASMSAIASASLKDGERLPIDECHAIDRAAPLGLPAPARGWIVELQARDDGLWGRVEWTEEGQRLMAGKAYRGISPAILHDKAKRVMGVLRASLINTPNLQGLTALHSEETAMDWKTRLIELLGLDGSADDAAIDAALSAKLNAKVELCSEDLLNLPAVVALQGQVNELTTQLNTVRDDQARKDAAAYVDGAIAEGRAGLKPVRDEYIALHMSNPASAQKLIGAMPVLKGTVLAGDPAPAAGEGGLGDADHQVMALMGLSEDEYKAGLDRLGMKKEAL